MSLGFGAIKQVKEYRGNVVKLVAITLDANYSSGGWAITPANVHLRKLRALILCGSDNGYPVHWDQVNGKLLIYKAVGTEETSASAHSGDTIYALAVGY